MKHEFLVNKCDSQEHIDKIRLDCETSSCRSLFKNGISFYKHDNSWDKWWSFNKITDQGKHDLNKVIQNEDFNMKLELDEEDNVLVIIPESDADREQIRDVLGIEKIQTLGPNKTK